MEDEFSEFLGLPSGIGASSICPPTGGETAATPQQKSLYNELYGSTTASQEKCEDGGYSDLFGETDTLPSVEFKKPDLERIQSLGHEPLFPDVDEAKIQPTVGLGSTGNPINVRMTAPHKEEFTIVLDPSSSDPRLTSPGSVPVADWVMQSGHNRREPVVMRQGTPLHGSGVPARPAGLHSGPGAPHYPMHNRSIGGGSGGPRTVKIPPGCNPELEPEFPTRAAPDQALKLPGQTRVTPDEYKEFLGLGHGEIFNLDLDRVVDPPWRAPGADTTDFFNYGMDENSWKAYCKAIECHRQEFSMKKKIQTYESSNMHFQQDPDLPPEVAAAIAAETYQARSGTGPDMAKALPIPVFQGTDDYSMRNRRGRDFRRPEVRYDPEVILELAGGVEPSNGVNADYGEDFIGAFAPSDLRQPNPKRSDLGGDIGQPSASALKTEEDTVNKNNEDGQETKKPSKDSISAMFEEDEFEDPRARSEMLRPGELAMGMDTEQHQSTQPWPSQKYPPAAGGPPRPEFGRMYDPYAPDMWRPFYPGRSWRPRAPYDRGPSDYWNAGRGYGRAHPDSRGGRYWHPYAGPRRPGRRPPIPRYYDDYHPSHPPWPRREDPHPAFHEPDPPREDEKRSVMPERPLRESFPPVEHEYYREHDRRRHSVEREDDRSRSYPRSRARDYDPEPRSSLVHHRDRARDYMRSHRREEYDDRHRDKRRRDRSYERDGRRRGYSKERSRPRDRERGRHYETSESESGSRYRTRSKDRD